jgi:hypothetical protein
LNSTYWDRKTLTHFIIFNYEGFFIIIIFGQKKPSSQIQPPYISAPVSLSENGSYTTNILKYYSKNILQLEGNGREEKEGNEG